MTEPGWVRKLTCYCLRHRGTLVAAFGAAMLAALITAAVPLVIRQVIDGVLAAGGRPAGVGTWLWLLIGLALLRYYLAYVSRYRAGRLCLDVAHELRVDFFTALGLLDGAGQDSLVTGQVISRATSDLSLVQGLLSVVPIMAGNILLFVVSLLVMLVLSPLLTAITLVVAPMLWWVAERARRRLLTANQAAQHLAGDLVTRLEHAITGVRVVKGFGQEARELDEMRHTARRLFAGRMRVIELQSRYSPMLQAITALGQIGVLLLGGWLALGSHITLGTFLTFATYLGQLVGPVRQVMSLLTMQQRAQAGIERVFEIIDTAPAVRDPLDPVPLGPGAPDIEFDRVHFGYGVREVLTGLSMTIPAGEVTALVGPAGAGKSTLIALLTRHYDPDAGNVRINGVDLRHTGLAEVRAKQGIAFQHSFLFSDTIRANIAYGDPDATDEQIRAAARAAEADRFIEALPDGYDTVVGERGFTLSGGQRQRIALARALLPDPAVLVLDDATSAVDPRTEAAINATLRVVAKSRTTLLIAHRRASLALADRVVVLDNGTVTHTGTVAQLHAHSPLFRSLFHDNDVFGSEPAEEPGEPGESSAEAHPAGTTKDHRSADPRIPDALAYAADPQFGLAHLLRPVWPVLVAGLVLVCLDAVAQSIVPALVRTGIDRGVAAGSVGVLLVISTMATIVLLVDWAVSTAGLRVIGRTGERLLYLVRVKAFAHLQRLGLDYYEREPSGRIISRMTTDIDALSDFLQTGPTTTLASLLTLAGVLIALLVLDTGLALVVLALVPLLLVATWLFRSRAAPTYVDARAKIGALNAQLQENVAGLAVTQVFGRLETNQLRFAQASRSYRDARLHAHRYLSLYFPFVQLLGDLAGVSVLGIGVARLHNGSLSAGVLIAFFLYLDAIFAPVQQLAQIMDSYRQASVSLARLRELLRTSTSIPAGDRAGRLAGPITEVAFRDVHFAYPGNPTDAVAGLDLVIRGGETVALVGETGAGKSTVAKLLARFYDVTAGAVLANGTDLRELDLREYRRRIGIVLQDPYLSPGTVRDTIAYGRPEATDAEVMSAARAVGAHRMITGLSGGYRYQVGEQGRNLSLGQQQLLALARAELVRPEILVLDEATAALDTASENAVTSAMARLARRRITILIAHRLRTAARADRIVMMAGGRIVEVGRHPDLLAAAGPYAALWSAYLGGDNGWSGNSSRRTIPNREWKSEWPIQRL